MILLSGKTNLLHRTSHLLGRKMNLLRWKTVLPSGTMPPVRAGLNLLRREMPLLDGETTLRQWRMIPALPRWVHLRGGTILPRGTDALHHEKKSP